MEAYLDDGIRETKRSKDAENLPGLRFSEFHAALAEQILRYWSMRGSVIVDPFSGRATRTVASKLGRNYQGYEVSRKTYDRCMSHLKSSRYHPNFLIVMEQRCYIHEMKLLIWYLLVLHITILKNTKLQKIN